MAAQPKVLQQCAANLDLAAFETVALKMGTRSVTPLVCDSDGDQTAIRRSVCCQLVLRYLHFFFFLQ